MCYLFNLHGIILDAVSCEKGPEICIDNFQVEQMVKKVIAKEVNFF
jgi:hypothetical protein